MTLAAGSIGKIELYMIRHAAHQEFARLWSIDVPGVIVGYKVTNRTRRALRRVWRKRRPAAYAWLAGKLGLTVDQCNFGLFGAETLERVIALCRAASSDEVCGRKDRAA